MTNSAISHGTANAILLGGSKDVTLDGNVIHDHVGWGINAGSSLSVINNNVVSLIKPTNANFPGYMRWEGSIGGINCPADE